MQITFAQAQAIMASPIFAMKLPTTTSFHFARLGKLIMGELKTFEEERQKLIAACNGVLSEDKTRFDFPEATQPAFTIGMRDLLQTAFEIPAFWPMALAQLGPVELSPNDLVQLDPLIQAPE